MWDKAPGFNLGLEGVGLWAYTYNLRGIRSGFELWPYSVGLDGVKVLRV